MSHKNNQVWSKRNKIKMEMIIVENQRQASLCSRTPHISL